MGNRRERTPDRPGVSADAQAALLAALESSGCEEGQRDRWPSRARLVSRYLPGLASLVSTTIGDNPFVSEPTTNTSVAVDGLVVTVHGPAPSTG